MKYLKGGRDLLTLVTNKNCMSQNHDIQKLHEELQTKKLHDMTTDWIDEGRTVDIV